MQEQNELRPRLPPGQHEIKGFPVLSLGPIPKIKKEDCSLEIFGLVKNPVKLSWNDLKKLGVIEIKKDIHCVTKWSKFDTLWKGVAFDKIIEKVLPKPEAKFIIARSSDGYSTNIPVIDLIDKKAIIAMEYGGKDISYEHGGPVRLLVPHLYLWKSAKWLKSIEFADKDKPGYWETRGYNNYGDPWKEQRYT